MDHGSLSKQICLVCSRLHNRNLIAAADGNVSARLDANTILITPSGVPKGWLESDTLARLQIDGTPISGKPSSESKMHLTVYNACPKARAVVHAHPPTAIAWTIARPDLKELPSDCVSEAILAMGSVPIVPYARPGADALGRALLPFVPNHRVLLLSRHGALSWGESLEEAYMGMERLEHFCQILKSAHELGGLTALPKAEVTALRELRSQWGDRTL